MTGLQAHNSVPSPSSRPQETRPPQAIDRLNLPLWHHAAHDRPPARLETRPQVILRQRLHVLGHQILGCENVYGSRLFRRDSTGRSLQSRTRQR